MDVEFLFTEQQRALIYPSHLFPQIPKFGQPSQTFNPKSQLCNVKTHPAKSPLPTGKFSTYHHHHHHLVTLLVRIFLTLPIHLENPSLPVGLPDYILYPHKAVVGKFLLVSEHWHIHVKGSIEEDRHL